MTATLGRTDSAAPSACNTRLRRRDRDGVMPSDGTLAADGARRRARYAVILLFG